MSRRAGLFALPVGPLLGAMLALGCSLDAPDAPILTAPSVGPGGYFAATPGPATPMPSRTPNVSSAILMPTQDLEVTDVAQMVWQGGATTQMALEEERSFKESVYVPFFGLDKSRYPDVFVWKSSQPEVVSVHPSTGLAKARKVGEATIKVWFKGQDPAVSMKSAEVRVTVTGAR